MPANRFWTGYAPAGTVAVFALVLLACLALLPGHLVIALVAAALSAASVFWWLSQVDSTIRMRRPKDWQWRIEVEKSRVSRRAFNRVRHYFLEGEKVLRVTHQRGIVLALNLSWVVALFLVLIALAVTLGTVSIMLPGHIALPVKTHGSSPARTANQPPAVKPALPEIPAVKPPVRWHWPKDLTIFWWVPLILAGICVLLAVRIWLRWVSWFFIITSERLVVLELPFPVFPFAEEDDNPFRLAIIKRAEVRGSSFRKRWGLAVMNISTYLQPEEDAVIKNLFGLPDPEDLKELINELTRDNSDELDQALGPQLKQLTAAVRENTEVQRRLHGQDDEAPTQEGW